MMESKGMDRGEVWTDADVAEMVNSDSRGKAPWAPPRVRTLSTSRDTETGSTPPGSDGLFFS